MRITLFYILAFLGMIITQLNDLVSEKAQMPGWAISMFIIIAGISLLLDYVKKSK